MGSLQAVDAVEIAAETEGRLIDIGFTEGGYVEKGDLLLKLDPEMPTARLKEAEARFRLAESELKRGRDLVESETISQQEFDRLVANQLQAEASLSAARRGLSDSTIVAPFSGMVGERRVSIGAIVSRGMPLTELVRLDPLEVEFHVPERYFSQLTLGLEVDVETVAHPNETFSATVSFVAPTLDLTTRTILVKATIPNSEGRLRPGMFGQALLSVRNAENALLIPEAAVITSVDGSTVAVLDDEDRVSFRPVTLGSRVPGRVEIVDGLEAGERVIVEGHQKVGPGSKVAISPDSSRFGIQAPDDTDEANAENHARLAP